MRIRAVLSAAALTWAVSACTSGGSHASPPASPSPDVISTPTRTKLSVGATPLWTGQTKGVPHYGDEFALHGDSLVMDSGPKESESDRLVVLDAATGKTRWSLRLWRSFPGGHGDEWFGGAYGSGPLVVDRGGDWGVLITTTRKSDARQMPFGLALLDGEDGHVLWRRKLVDADARPDGHRVYPSAVLADDEQAVVSLRPSSGATADELRLVAVDARTGKRLWTRTGIRPTAVLSGSVVGAEFPASSSFDDAGAGTVTVLDAATGRTRWSRPSPTTTRVFAVAGGLVLVRSQQAGTLSAPVILDLATGGEVARMSGQIGNCFDDRTSLIACETLVPEPRLFTIAPGERAVRIAARRPPEGVITLVRDGRIYFSGSGTAGQELDRSGTPLVDRMPDGVLRAISDKYAVFGLSGNRPYQVYRTG